MLYICFLNVVVDSDFIKRFTALSHDRTYLNSIYLFFSSSWVYETYFGGIYLVLPFLIYPSFICAMHASLSSYKMGGYGLTDIPLLDWMCLLIDIIQPHSLLSSWREIFQHGLKKWLQVFASENTKI